MEELDDKEYTYFFDEAEFQQYKQSCDNETAVDATDGLDKFRPDRDMLLNINTYLDSKNEINSNDQGVIDLSTTQKSKIHDYGSTMKDSMSEHSQTGMNEIFAQIEQNDTNFENLQTREITNRDLCIQAEGNVCNKNVEPDCSRSKDRITYDSVTPLKNKGTYHTLNQHNIASFTGGAVEKETNKEKRGENSSITYSHPEVSQLTRHEVIIKQTVTSLNGSCIQKEASEQISLVETSKSVAESGTSECRCNERQSARNTLNIICNGNRGCVHVQHSFQFDKHRHDHCVVDAEHHSNVRNQSPLINSEILRAGTPCGNVINGMSNTCQSQISGIGLEMKSSCKFDTDNDCKMRNIREKVHNGQARTNSRTSLNCTIDLTKEDNSSSTRRYLLDTNANNMKHKKDTESFCYLKRQKMTTDSENIKCPKYDIFFAEILKHYLPVGNLSCGALQCNKDYYAKKLEDITASLLAGFSKAHANFSERTKSVTKIKNADHITNNDLHNMCSHFMAELVKFSVEFSNCIRAFGILSKDQQKIQVKQSLLEMSVIYSAYWYSERSCDLLLETYGLDVLKQRLVRVGPMGVLLHSLHKTTTSLKLLQLKKEEFILMATMVLLSPDRSGSTTETISHLRKLEEIACVTLKWNMLSVHGASANALFERTIRKLVDIRLFSELHLQSFLLSRIG